MSRTYERRRLVLLREIEQVGPDGSKLEDIRGELSRADALSTLAVMVTDKLIGKGLMRDANGSPAAHYWLRDKGRELLRPPTTPESGHMRALARRLGLGTKE